MDCRSQSVRMRRTTTLAGAVAIARRHDRKSFDCGSPELKEYLGRYARQNHESGGAKTFVTVLPSEPTRVLGYYPISPGPIEFARVDDHNIHSLHQPLRWNWKPQPGRLAA
jgi:hypothetical protein